MKTQIKQTQLINEAVNRGFTAKLARAAVRQFGNDYAYFCESQAPDVVNYGIAGGFGYYVYHADTVAFTKKHKKDILKFSEQMADEFGESLSGFFASFKCFQDYSESEIIEALYNPKSENQTVIYNGLAWFIGEEIARVYCDMLENLENS